MNDFDLAACRQETARSVTRTCRQERSAAALAAELRRLSDKAETRIDQLGGGDRSLIACGPGCSTCCVVNVSTLIPEGLAIVRYVGDWPTKDRDELTEKLEELWGVVRGLDDEERLAVRRGCAFLGDQGMCRIYPVRPMLCRSVSSIDADACRKALTEAIFDEEPPVLMHQLQQDLYETIFCGFGAGLEQVGLDGRSFQVSGLVRYLLEHPQWERDYLRGERLSWGELY